MEHFEKTLAIVCNAVRSVREDEFERLKRDCHNTLNDGGKIVLSGLGKNVPICEKFVGTLNSLEISAAFMHTNTAAHGDLGIVRNEDIVIVLSKSGETMESVYLVELLEKKKCKIWLISFNGEGLLCKKVPNRLIINLEHEGDQWNILPNNSSVINLIVLQELAMCIAKEKSISIDVLRINHPGGAIGKKLAGGVNEKNN